MGEAPSRSTPGQSASNGTVHAPDIQLRSSISSIPGVGKSRGEKFRRLGINTIGDLLRHLPMRYEYEAAEGSVKQLQYDVIGSARGVVLACRWVRGRGGRSKGRFEATLQDDSGTLHLTWFNAGYLRGAIHPGMRLWVQGKVGEFGGHPQMVNPKWERLDQEEEAESRGDHAQGSADARQREDRFRPVYPATEDLKSSVIEQIVAQALPTVLPQVDDPVPHEVLRRNAMPGLRDAFRMAHQPEHEEEANAARRRLAFNELLLLQLGMEIKRYHNATQCIAPALRWSEAIDEHIRGRFPFDLTKSQDEVVHEIAEDVGSERPMNRLVQGDVGSGKTVVALYAMLMAVANRLQAAIMAPTELLAEQHYLSLSSMLEGSNVRLAILTASRGAAKQEVYEKVERGEVDIVIGTQALLSEKVRFNELGVVVVDEQHRFGVLQRAAFRQRQHGASEAREDGKLWSPHYLVMTATPIPRTLSLTVFGDLDVSTIRELPGGRTPIATRVMPSASSDKVYRHVAERIGRGEQAYVVVPVIEETETQSGQQLRNVKQHAEMLQERYFTGMKVASVHGKLKRESRERIMHQFRAGKIDVLVATTVIEVGVDVPNATVMVIEHAERFGLAQLHQLRGRIGRGETKSTPLCALIADPTTDEGRQRLEAINATRDGFRIAERDLEIRGMGDFFGTRQHGLPPLRIASLPHDLELLQLAKRDARKLIEADPALERDEHEMLRKLLVKQYGESLGLVDVG